MVFELQVGKGSTPGDSVSVVMSEAQPPEPPQPCKQKSMEPARLSWKESSATSKIYDYNGF
jgi:hypothetical protein